MVTILTYGTYDTFHYGHLELFLRAKALGDRLIVGVSTDEFNLLKKKQCKFAYSTRVNWVQNIRAVDLVIPETSWEQKLEDIVKYNASILVMGDDWAGHFDHLPVKTVYVPRTPGISTTQIKTLLK